MFTVEVQYPQYSSNVEEKTSCKVVKTAVNSYYRVSY